MKRIDVFIVRKNNKRTIIRVNIGKDINIFRSDVIFEALLSPLEMTQIIGRDGGNLNVKWGFHLWLILFTVIGLTFLQAYQEFKKWQNKVEPPMLFSKVAFSILFLKVVLFSWSLLYIYNLWLYYHKLRV